MNHLCFLLFSICNLNLIIFVSVESLEDALKQLYLIDAIDDTGLITSVGQTMAGNGF